jgi:hypothetical protein
MVVEASNYIEKIRRPKFAYSPRLFFRDYFFANLSLNKISDLGNLLKDPEIGGDFYYPAAVHVDWFLGKALRRCRLYPCDGP